MEIFYLKKMNKTVLVQPSYVFDRFSDLSNFEFDIFLLCSPFV